MFIREINRVEGRTGGGIPEFNAYKKHPGTIT
ncbi:hypothetical protein HBHAL_1755 [Halobacillus halophilus DSM 2266]|uniref:Uncharacterized protein n=1 Tax=Halobacillus halophilus (strain ATCC 35676 / DSM 2266 / JCM 20832 / KCTC 3685 / LMG 17431 / NBRC 102448 / NCIMB 2269) TaxID=866895 RepID=I0JJ02_HALH3|nr:hypothetical protein HBHAL_1755 [Halobacillus halophilus DSM 2266]